MKTTYFPQMTNNANNVNWKNEMKLDVLQNPRFLPPEPYCSGKTGSVIGKCNKIKENCPTTQPDPECTCTQETGKIEKCSKYFAVDVVIIE